jgi:hypothetical protein
MIRQMTAILRYLALAVFMLTVFTSPVYTSIARASAEWRSIKCPVGTVHVEITTPLPSPCWHTPQDRRLVRARLQTLAASEL